VGSSHEGGEENIIGILLEKVKKIKNRITIVFYI